MHILNKSILLFSTLVASGAQAGEFLEQNGVALSRLDALSYFSHDQKLMDGDQQKSFIYKGSKFYFITSSHLDAFKSDPARYAPQFGGYCAYNAAQGRQVPANPRVFALQDGKLYLFSDRESLRHWKEDVAANVARASQAWPALAAAGE